MQHRTRSRTVLQRLALRKSACYLENNVAASVTKINIAVRPYLEQLKTLAFVESAEVKRSASDDEQLTLHVVAKRKTHSFELGLLRTHLSMPEVERWIGKAQSLGRKRPLLLLAPYVSRPMGARLREAGVRYLDQAGNMHFVLGEGAKAKDSFAALVEGKRAPKALRSDAAWRAPGYQVLFALLVKPELLAAPVRTIAAQAGVSTSPVLQIQKKLLQAGIAVARRGEWQWTPRGQSKARELWLHGYNTTLRPHLLIGRYRARTPLAPEQLEKVVEKALHGDGPVRWGGAAAAQRLDGYYRGDRTVVHIANGGLTAASLAGTLRMVPDPEGPLLVLGIPGPCALDSPKPNTVHPLLAWAELLEEGHDRASEAAERLARTFLQDSHA